VSEEYSAFSGVWDWPRNTEMLPETFKSGLLLTK